MICNGILGKIGIEKYETVEDELKLVILKKKRIKRIKNQNLKISIGFLFKKSRNQPTIYYIIFLLD